MIEEILNQLVKKANAEAVDYVFNWLKENGYNPERTAEWCNEFKKRLEKQGKFLRVETFPITFQQDNFKVKCEQYTMCFIDNIKNPIPLEEIIEEVKNAKYNRKH